jgi:hypothetical protein
LFETAPIVLNALVCSLAPEESSTQSASVTSPASQTQSQSQTASAASALDMLATIIGNKDATFPPELRANACLLLLHMERGSGHEGMDKEKLSTLRDMTRGVLQGVAASQGDKATPGEKIVAAAAKRVLESYCTA